MKITFDAAKNERNIRERGLPFTLAAEFDFQTAVTVEDTRHDYGEKRYRSLGWINDKLYALVFTFRGESVRVISPRTANRKERKRYAEASQP